MVTAERRPPGPRPSGVTDPELPMLTLADLGVLRGVSVDGGTVEVAITPTYSGCPAMTEMSRALVGALAGAGFADVRVRVELSPAWSTDWISPRGRGRWPSTASPRPVRRRAGPARCRSRSGRRGGPSTVHGAVRTGPSWSPSSGRPPAGRSTAAPPAPSRSST